MGINSTGHFELSIDSHKTTYYLKSVDGGWIKSALIKENVGPENQQIKHGSTVEIDPFSIEIGLASAKEILGWIKQSWSKDPQTRNGQLQHANMNLKTVFLHEFMDAMIMETQIPGCDASSSETAYLKMKMLPQTVKTTALGGTQDLSANTGQMQKQWSLSMFRFHLDGVKDSQYTNKLESFTVKQGVTKHYTGKNRFPRLVPTKIEYPQLSGTIALEYADGFKRWHDDTNAFEQGNSGLKAEKSGTLEFLGPDADTILFAVHFYGVILSQLQIVSSSANGDSRKMVKFDLQVNRMELDDMSGMDSGDVV